MCVADPPDSAGVGDVVQRCRRAYVIRIRVTTFNHQDQPRGEPIGTHWNADIRAAFAATNQVLNPYRIDVEQSDRRDLSVDASRHLLTENIRNASRGGGVRAYRGNVRVSEMVGRQAYEQSGAPHYLGRVYFANIRQMATDFVPNAGQAGSEGLPILRMNRRSQEVGTYWVPGITDGQYAAGHTLFGPLYGDVSRRTEGILMAPHAGRDTLVHELVHLLTKAGHVSFEGPNGEQEGSAGPDNIMHPFQSARTGRTLTAGQLHEIQQRGRYYLRRR
jgi:hypothetical protein